MLLKSVLPNLDRQLYFMTGRDNLDNLTNVIIQEFSLVSAFIAMGHSRGPHSICSRINIHSMSIKRELSCEFGASVATCRYREHVHSSIGYLLKLEAA